MSQQPQRDTRSASEKISDLENAVMSLYNTLDNMARDLANAKEAIRLLNSKTSAIIKASSDGQGVSDITIERLMVENEVERLKEKIEVFKAQGVLVPAEVVTDTSFVVGSEENDAGETVNPRTQFVLAQLNPPELQEKIKGAKVGDLLTLQEGKLKLKVTEIYAIQSPAAPGEEAAPAADAASESAPSVGNA